MLLKKENFSRLYRKFRPQGSFKGGFVVFVVVLSVILILWYAGAGVRNIVAYSMVDDGFLNYGKIQQKESAESLLIKRETVINAPVTGKVKYLANDGDRLRQGTAVVRLETPDLNSATGRDDVILYNPRAGVFCLHLDGYEKILSADKFDVLSIPKLEKITNGSTSLQTGEQKENKTVQSGQPVYKLVDNLSPIIFKIEIPVSMMPQRCLNSGSLKMHWRNYSFKGRIIDYKRQNSLWDVLISVEEYPNELLHYRKINLLLVVQESAGLVVDRKAIVLKEGRPGIYIIDRANIRWVPVTLKGQTNDKVIVSEGNLTAGISYVKNPIWFEIGSMDS